MSVLEVRKVHIAKLTTGNVVSFAILPETGSRVILRSIIKA